MCHRRIAGRRACRRLSILAGATVLGWLIPAAPGWHQVDAREADGQAPDPSDLRRVEELFHLTDEFGPDIWPGFDTRTIPIAVNHDDRQELLVNHPAPPPEFGACAGLTMNGRPVMVMDGCTRFGPRGGGWSVEIAGEETAYVSTLQPGESTDQYLSTLLHECFHVYQGRYRDRADGPLGDLPEDDPVYAALIGLESRILHAIVTGTDTAEARELAKMFVAVRLERRTDLPEALVRTEGEREYAEGTASYAQVRLAELIAAAPEFEPLHPDADAQYAGFRHAGDLHEALVSRILPPAGMPISFFHSQYQIGMALCLVLDLLRDGWKQEMTEPGSTQFGILEREIRLDQARRPALLAAAKERFDYQDLLEEQTRLVEERLDTIRGHIQAAGRRYRVYHGDIPESFRWKPHGPVYEVPPRLMEEIDRMFGAERLGDPDPPATTIIFEIGGLATLWVGGIRRLERGELVFESGEVPILFRHDYLQWIDTDPRAPLDDLRIESDSSDGEVHRGLKLTTEGFVLQVPIARVHVTDEIVAIYPLTGE